MEKVLFARMGKREKESGRMTKSSNGATKVTRILPSNLRAILKR